jgi:hypothetical protein
MKERVIGKNTGMVGGVVVETRENGCRVRTLRNCNQDVEKCILAKLKKGKCVAVEGPVLSIPLQGFILDCGKFVNADQKK